jgi:hypothetical protein
MLVERRNCLGGMMTSGNCGLTKYIVHEKDPAEYRKVVEQLSTDPASVQVVGGLPMEITRRLLESGSALGTNGQPGSYVFATPEDFKLLLLEMMEQDGVRLLLHSPIVDVIRDGRVLKGVVVENKSGRQVLLARQFVDATGDGDVAAAAGVPFVLGVGPDDLAAKEGTAPGTTQQMGVMFRAGGIDMAKCFEYLKENPDRFSLQHFALMELDDACESFLRGDMSTLRVNLADHSFQIYNSPLPGVFTFCCPKYPGNGLSVEDLTRAEIDLLRQVKDRVARMRESLPGFENAFLLDCPEVGVRETRHMLGEYVLNIEDILTQRDFEDSIGKGGHPIDIQPVPDFIRNRPLAPRWFFKIPYRSLVAKSVDNLLLAGRCISNTHEASGCTRPTVPCMITGQAAGTAAAMCAQTGVAPRDLDAVGLQKKLRDQGVDL